MNQEAVTSGNVTLPRNASSVEIGLPFTSTITLLPAEFAAQDGSIMGESTAILCYAEASTDARAFSEW